VTAISFKRRLLAGHIKPLRSKAYLNYVSSLECCGCGAPADEAHHIIAAGLGGGIGTKASDLLIMPVCRKCHDDLHRDVKLWEQLLGSQYKHICLTILQAVDDGVINL
jgi:hypothetical protein